MKAMPDRDDEALGGGRGRSLPEEEFVDTRQVCVCSTQFVLHDVAVDSFFLSWQTGPYPTGMRSVVHSFYKEL